MISKNLLKESGFDRVQGSSVWHNSEADVYVTYIDIVIQGEATVLDARTSEDDDLIKALKTGLEASVEDVIVEESIVEEAIVGETIVEEAIVEETVISNTTD